MRKFIHILLMMTVLTAVSCQKTPTGNGTPDSPQQEDKLTIDPPVLQMTIGDIELVTVKGASKALVWTTDAEDVATVEDGFVEAVGIGMAHITATSGRSSITCEVYVSGKDGAELRINPAFVAMKRGESVQLKGRNASGLPATWSVSDESLATIDENGLLTAKQKGGNVTVTYRTEWDSVSIIAAIEHIWNDYRLVWSDEFDGTTLNSANWNIEVNNSGGGNGEAQYYTDRAENIRVENGELVIQARKEHYIDREYTSARIQSRDKQMFTYGKIEARIMLPTGSGTWPAFWTLGKGNWPACGEIDIMEHVGYNPNRIIWTLHTTKDRSGSKSSRAAYIDNIVNNWHVFGIEWMQEENQGHDVIRFYVDDTVYSTQTEGTLEDTAGWPFNRPNYILLNLALGGSLGGDIDDRIFDNDIVMKVDWVRVYQRTEKE